MEKQEIRTFGRRHGKKLSARQQWLLDNILPTLLPKNESGNELNILEIGFGAGEHLQELAIKNPEKIIIGAEPFMNGVASLLSAITDEKNSIRPEYKNIRIYPDDVRKFLKDTDSKFKHIWILHPDPWPKAKHEKRRLLHSEFIKSLSDHLANKGEIIIGTDHWEYYDWIIQEIKKTKLKIDILNIPVIQTRYQNKNMAETNHPKYLIIKN